MVGSAFRSSFLFEHDLFGKPDSTFPDHALGRLARKQQRLKGLGVLHEHGTEGIEAERAQAAGHRMRRFAYLQRKAAAAAQL